MLYVRELIGSGHQEVLRLLRTRLAAIAEGDTAVPRVLVLEGASGVGKSRVVRELYRTLRAERRDPYWPEITETGAGSERSRDPLPGRKSLGPKSEGFVWPVNALPTFGWWQLACERAQTGVTLDVVAQARPELEAHLTPLALAWADAASIGDRVARQRDAAFDRLKEALAEGGVEAASRVLAHFDIVVPGLGTALSWLTAGVRAGREAWELRQLAARDVDLYVDVDRNRRSLSDELADLITGVTHPNLPSVLVVEDVHLMDAGLATLLDRLAMPAAGRPLMVVATAWPESRNAPSYEAWRVSGLHRGYLEMVEMPQLAEPDLVRMVREFAPATGDDAALAIARKLANPLVLEATLSTQRAQRAISTNGNALPLVEVETLPSAVRAVYRDRFLELEHEVRTSLALCAGVLPDVSVAASWPFFRTAVADAAHACEFVDIDGSAVLRGVEVAASAAAWIVSSGVADSFHETLQAEMAHEYLTEMLGSNEREVLRSAVVEQLGRWIDQNRDGYWLDATDRATVACSWYLGIGGTGARPQSPADVAARYLVARRAAAELRYTDAIDTLRPVVQTAGVGPDWFSLRGAFVLWLLEAGRVVDAIAECRALLANREQAFGADHPENSGVRGILATAYQSAGDLGKAVPLFARVVSDYEKALGTDHPDTQTGRNNLALAYESAGDLARALPLLEKNLDDRGRVLGPDHPDTLASRNNLAFVYQSAGDLGSAVPLFEQVVSDCLRMLGPDHPNTLKSRSNLAGAYQSLGDLSRAIPLFEQNLADFERVLGPSHPDTMTGRNNLAITYHFAGDLGRAIPLFEQNLNERVRVLGPDHPNTLASRRHLAGAYQSVGDLTRAVALFEQNLEDCERVLGLDHPETLTGRGNLASAYKAAGHLDSAVPILEQNLADCERILGPDHPDTLTARNNLALAYQSAGDLGRALDLLEQDLTDRDRVLGPDHPETLISRSNLASAYQAAGDPGRAVTLFEQIRADFERVLGSDHPKTLISASNLAGACQAAGKVGRAVTLFEQNAIDRERVLGPDHPETLTSRSNLAGAYQTAGDPGRAVTLFEQNLADCLRMLGPDHPNTLTSRSNLAGAYQAVGDLDRARVMYEQSLADYERVLGREAYLTRSVRALLEDLASERSDTPPPR